MARFAPLTPDTAAPELRGIMSASTQQLGFLAGPVARAAHSPALLRHLLAGFAAFERTSLTPLEREVVAMTVAFARGCHYCMALHSSLLAAQPEHAQVLAALRSGGPLDDARLTTLRGVVEDLLVAHGRIPEARVAAFVAAGFAEAQLLDVVLGVAVYELSTTTNILTGAPIDPPFAPFAWERP